MVDCRIFKEKSTKQLYMLVGTAYDNTGGYDGKRQDVIYTNGSMLFTQPKQEFLKEFEEIKKWLPVSDWLSKFD